MAQIHDLNNAGKPAPGTFFVTDNGTDTGRAGFNEAGQAFIEDYQGSSLAGEHQSPKAALDKLGLAVDSLGTLKADQTALQAEATARETADSELKSALNNKKGLYDEIGIQLDSFIIQNASVSSNGLLESEPGEDLYCCNVEFLNNVVVTGGALYGFFAVLPAIGKRSYNSSRVIQTLNNTIITVPKDVSYICVRVKHSGSVMFNSLGLLTTDISTQISKNVYMEGFEYITGKNLFNADEIEVGYYYPYNTGVKTQSDLNCTGNLIQIGSEEQFYLNNYSVHICYYNRTGAYISGVVPSSSVNTTPKECFFMRISGGKNSLKTMIVALGGETVAFEPYMLYSNVPDFDRNDYNLAYVYNKKVCGNRTRPNETAYYSGVDVLHSPTDIVCKFIWEVGTSSGKLALISNPNGLTKISDITGLSLHLTLDYNYIKLTVLGRNIGEYYYATLIERGLANNMVMDGITENTVHIHISGNIVTVTVNNDTYTGTYDGQEPFSNVYGRYITFEHFVTGDRYSKSLPMITYFEVYGGEALHIKDNFCRENGILCNTPQGVPYVLISNDFNFDS